MAGGAKGRAIAGGSSGGGRGGIARCGLFGWRRRISRRWRGLTIEAVAAGTLAARTAHVEGTLSGLDAGKTVGGTFSGDADFTRHASDMNLRISEEGAPVSMEILIVDGATYVRLPDEGAEGLSFDGKFLKLPADAFFGNSGSDLPIGASTVGFGVADPVDALRQLRLLSSEVRDLGNERVDGIETTHAQFTTTLELLFACAKEPDPDAENSNSLCEPSVASRDATIDVYVDAQSRIVRLETKVDAGNKLTINSRVDYSRFGDAVDISVPPKSEVLDMSDYTDAGENFGKHTTVTGAWHEITSGTVAGVHWSLASAPAKGSICVDFVATPPVAMAPNLMPLGPTVTRDGREVPCNQTLMIALQDVAVVSKTARGGAVVGVVGLTHAGVSSMVAHLADGTTQPVSIDADTGAFVWVGPPAAKLISLTADSEQGPITCSDDPTILADNADSPPLEIESPYFCTPNAKLHDR